MRVMMVGTSHRHAALADREGLALDMAGAVGLGRDLRAGFAGVESLVVSTCNRTEVYVARPSHAGPSDGAVRAALAARCGVGLGAVEAVCVTREQEPAIRHLVRVCCGLDSMVLGEAQVLGQVKRAYAAASEAGLVGPVLHQVFQGAVGAGKRVRMQTGLDRGRTSVASVAVGFAEAVFSGLEDKTVVGLGAGELTKLLLGAMVRRGCGRVWVANRRVERAEALCEVLRRGGRAGGAGRGVEAGARSLEDLETLLVEADVLACGTGASEPVVTAGMLRGLARRRRGRPLLVLDVAVPRDVEAKAGGLANVFLYDLDALREAAERGQAGREGAAAAAEAAAAAASERCLRTIQNRDLGRLVKQLRSKLHDLGAAEAERTCRRLEGVGGGLGDGAGGDAAAILADHDRRLINKLLHVPLQQLHEAGEDAPLGFYAAALRRLFDLEDLPSDGTGGGGGVAEDAASRAVSGEQNGAEGLEGTEAMEALKEHKPWEVLEAGKLASGDAVEEAGGLQARERARASMGRES